MFLISQFSLAGSQRRYRMGVWNTVFLQGTGLNLVLKVKRIILICKICCVNLERSNPFPI